MLLYSEIFTLEIVLNSIAIVSFLNVFHLIHFRINQKF